MRLIARYAKEREDHYELVTVYDEEIIRQSMPKSDPSAVSIAAEHPVAVWFERKIADDYGISFDGAHDRRPLVHQEHFPLDIHPMRRSFTDDKIDSAEFHSYPYEEIKGDGVFQVAVGPIHAGIIEPGHFQFSQAGEAMLHLEVRHFYKYRAIEKMLEGKSLPEAKATIERISGNESIAYQIAWREIAADAAGIEVPHSLRVQHVFLLELERIIHHFTDLGFIPNDAGFAAALAWASRLAEDSRRCMKLMTGHRFGFGAIAWQGFEWDAVETIEWIEYMQDELARFKEWISDVPSVWDRFDTTGRIDRADAIKHDTVGVVARSCSIAQDRRLGDPLYESHGFEVVTHSKGDVAARFLTRLDEVKVSLDLMRSFIEESPDAESSAESVEYRDGEYMSFVESSLGELFMSIDICDGVIERFYVRDPSFINWQTLHLMMSNDIIADFPLINKSCDLSYAGNDL